MARSTIDKNENNATTPAVRRRPTIRIRARRDNDAKEAQGCGERGDAGIMTDKKARIRVWRKVTLVGTIPA
jgi:hypothetical protein